MDLDLGQDTEINVTYRGQKYLMHEPTVSQVERFRESNQIIEFLTVLGLPKEVAESLPLSKVELLVRSITDAISKKK